MNGQRPAPPSRPKTTEARRTLDAKERADSIHVLNQILAIDTATRVKDGSLDRVLTLIREYPEEFEAQSSRLGRRPRRVQPPERGSQGLRPPGHWLSRV